MKYKVKNNKEKTFSFLPQVLFQVNTFCQPKNFDFVFGPKDTRIQNMAHMANLSTADSLRCCVDFADTHTHIHTYTDILTNTHRTRNWSVNYAYATLSLPSFRFLLYNSLYVTVCVCICVHFSLLLLLLCSSSSCCHRMSWCLLWLSFLFLFVLRFPA